MSGKTVDGSSNAKGVKQGMTPADTGFSNTDQLDKF
jgi:hypothetical protein